MLEKDNKIWDKVSNRIKKDFDSKSVDNEKYLKAKLKSCEGRKNTDFHDKEIPKKGSHCTNLLVILILFLKIVKTIIHNCFYKNLNKLLKKKRCEYILMLT